jgi:hypothetical protein
MQIKATVNDVQLQQKIQEVARAANKTIEEQSRVVMKGLVRYVLTYTPPASQRAQGLAARATGEVAVVRDMKKLFRPVILKGKRPEQWPDPHALHHAAFSGGTLRRPAKKFHVDKAKITALKTTLQKQVGLLSSGWARAAITLGVDVPAWVLRHAGSGRGTDLEVAQTQSRVSYRVTNHMPSTAGAIAAQTQRLVDSAKRAQLNGMIRQLPYLLKRNL